ncbi:unnamed protein product [Lepeophtheirus salmonis]|uniref:(salmon louse) hypothetical protein n=1 Tax=Lepeophtheirus salmonis TaxID=72036 RepID=A0A7R8CN88_LEPSM|nr:unnamed protein product [Lepeophtheirus salmonis]CAF2873241.1 unnamed protein product [Lepeophtheirus salmonis]
MLDQSSVVIAIGDAVELLLPCTDRRVSPNIRRSHLIKGKGLLIGKWMTSNQHKKGNERRSLSTSPKRLTQDQSLSASQMGNFNDTSSPAQKVHQTEALTKNRGSKSLSCFEFQTIELEL